MTNVTVRFRQRNLQRLIQVPIARFEVNPRKVTIPIEAWIAFQCLILFFEHDIVTGWYVRLGCSFRHFFRFICLLDFCTFLRIKKKSFRESTSVNSAKTSQVFENFFNIISVIRFLERRLAARDIFSKNFHHEILIIVLGQNYNKICLLSRSLLKKVVNIPNRFIFIEQFFLFLNKTTFPFLEEIEVVSELLDSVLI